MQRSGKQGVHEESAYMCEPWYAARAALTAAFVASSHRKSKGGGVDCMLIFLCSKVTSFHPGSTLRFCPMRGTASSPQSSSPDCKIKIDQRLSCASGRTTSHVIIIVSECGWGEVGAVVAGGGSSR